MIPHILWLIIISAESSLWLHMCRSRRKDQRNWNHDWTWGWHPLLRTGQFDGWALG